MKTTSFLMIFLSSVSLLTAKPKLETRKVEYQSAGKTMEGYLSADRNRKGKRPGIIVIHEWTGLGDYAMKRADMLAELGYVAFAMDMYGKGVRAKDHTEAAKLIVPYNNDRKLMVTRINDAMTILKADPDTDATKIAVIGYCFGGGAAIEYALSGADIRGVVSFHGMLGSPNLDKAAAIKAKLLIHHGGDDFFIPAEGIKLFQDTMKKNKVSLEFVVHPGAVHGFTRDTAGSDKKSGIAYNKAADQKSWASMKKFFAAIFK